MCVQAILLEKNVFEVVEISVLDLYKNTQFLSILSLFNFYLKSFKKINL